MKKICVVCGNEFIAKTNQAKYCCKKCANHSRFNQTLEERQESARIAKKRVLELYDSDLSVEEISKEVGKCPTFIHTTWREAGKPKRWTPYQRQVAELRRQGLCSAEISKILNIDCKQINTTARLIGMPFTDEEKQRSIQIGIDKNKRSDEQNKKYGIEFIQTYHPEWEYVSGQIGSDDYMEIKHIKCGHIISKSAIRVRRKNQDLICPYCRKEQSAALKEQRKQEQEQRQEQRQEERIQQKIEKFWSQPFDQAALSFCPVCNGAYFGNRKYCSDICAQKVMNARHKDKRIRKLQSICVDSDIDLYKLYQRDNGICHICGDKCDFEDFTRGKNGCFIVGITYPSIDHVIPISKGGMHSWDNVKLAHHYCNTLKSNKVVSL